MTNIKYAGKDFRQDLGLYVDSIESYGTPKKSYTFHEVLGRNGSLAVDDHRFEDHEETFNCYIRQDFVPNFRNVQAFFNSLKGYQRLERSNEPDYFEMGLYEGEISPRPTQLLQAGAFPFRLRLHPEKWLKSGETAVDAASTSETLEGNPIQFDNPSGLTALTGLSVDVEPVQDLNGYDHPWVGGAGKNLLNDSIKTQNGNSVLFAGATGSSDTEHYFTLSAGTYTFSVELVDGTTTNMYIKNVDTQGGVATKYDTNSVTFTVAETTKCVAWIYGTTVANVEHAMIESGSTATAYAPYENICPITGHTSATVQRTVDGSSTDYTIDLNGTVYGGTLDVLTGVLTVTDENIASYNGETLPSTWISDRDVYASGTTPTTGAQVVYKLATPTTVQLTAQQVSLLTGTNIISTDMDSVTVTVSNPSELENPTLFESKPLIRIYGTGTVNINNDYITIDSASPFTFIDLDCETMNASSAGDNANQYIEILNDAEITLKPGTNYVAYSGSITKVEITPRWYTI